MAKKQEKEKSKYRCRDCVNSYDWQEKNYQGVLFMCRCQHHKNGKFIKFLSDPQCEKFKLKQ